MFTFENRVGPAELAAKAHYPQRETPRWFQDAKLGFFIHYGLYSIPAWAYQPDGTTYGLEDAYTYHQYAEWYGNTWRIPNSPCRQWHEETYGVGTTYADFAEQFHPNPEKLAATVQLLIDSGAKYIVPTTKHHDGFCLWNTQTTDFNSVKRGNGVDVIKLITELTRAHNIHVGLYFSGALDWHVSDFPAIQSDRDIFTHRRNDVAYAKYSAAQLRELIETFNPQLLWNDIDWPDAGKGDAEYSLSNIFAHYYEKVPDGIINDRWGIPYHQYLTREYTDVDETLSKPWESTRGIAKSFGVNHNEDDKDFLTVTGLVNYFIDVVSKGGNLLINVGPNADGSLESRQAKVVAGLGQWMKTYGEYIYASRPWETPLDIQPASARYLRLPANHPHPGLAVFLLNPNAKTYRVPVEIPAGKATWLLPDKTLDVEISGGMELTLPDVTSDLPILLHIPNN